MALERSIVSKERVVNVISGWVVLPALVVVGFADVVYLANGRPKDFLLFACIAIFVLVGFGLVGFFSLQPNEARVLTLFGAYKGTVRTSGFWWANPLYGGGRYGSAIGGPLASRPLNRVTQRSKLPQKKCTGLIFPWNPVANRLNSVSAAISTL